MAESTPSQSTLTSRTFIDLNIPNLSVLHEEEPLTHLIPDSANVRPGAASVVENQIGSPLLHHGEGGRMARNRSVRTRAGLDWLPGDWLVEHRKWAGGGTAERVDRYYVDPVSGRKFRSKNEVLYYLETGSKRKKKPNSDSDATPSESRSVQKPKKSKTRIGDFSGLNFDFRNPPQKVSWALTSASQDKWMPIGSEGMVPEPLKREWDKAFTCIAQLDQVSRPAY